MPDEAPNPYEPPRSKPKEDQRPEVNPYWGRHTLLDRFSALGIRGKLAFWGCFLLLINLGTYLCGFYMVKLLVVGCSLLIASIFVTDEMDD